MLMVREAATTLEGKMWHALEFTVYVNGRHIERFVNVLSRVNETLRRIKMH